MQTVTGVAKAPQKSFGQRYGLIIGFIVLLVAILLPTPEGLPVAGQRMIGILFFSVIVWMTDAVSYPVSAAVIMTLMAFLHYSLSTLTDQGVGLTNLAKSQWFVPNLLQNFNPVYGDFLTTSQAGIKVGLNPIVLAETNACRSQSLAHRLAGQPEVLPFTAIA
jgi:hypothetical protein